MFFRNLLTVALAFILISCGGGGGGGSAPAPIPAPQIPVRADFVLRGLSFPSALAFAPDGRLFFAELPTGNIRVVENGKLQAQPFAQVPIPFGGADGIYGIAFDPGFQENHFFYVFHTAPNPNRNRLVRFVDAGTTAANATVILDNLPSGGHNGGKLAFGRDGNLFISGGDTGKPDLAQSLETIVGKVLRIAPDGSIPADNPIPGSPIYALGFRNIYGLAVHPISGALYGSDNGPDCDDEINKIVPGGNYGWSLSEPCGDMNNAFVQPLVRINPVVGVTGIAFYQGAEFPEYDGHILLADFNGGAVRRYAIDDEKNVVLQEALFYEGGSGSITDIAVDAAGVVYATTTDAILSLRRKM